MKNTLLIAIAVISILFAACNSSAKNSGASSDTASSVKTTGIIYTCPMHTEVVNDKPGKCPECGMTLVKKENDKKDRSGKKM